MKKIKFLIFLITLLSSSLTNAQDDADVLQYIEQYKKLAMQEQVRSGIPASITLAQGIHESASGKSELATLGNNHFGIKCKSTWKGATILHDDDARQECFRKYASSEDSYIDHSNFLRQSNRYSFLFDLDVTDYKGWASGLKRAGYATNPLYVKRLTDLVEKYNLQQYTYEAQTTAFRTPKGEVVPNEDATTSPKVENPVTESKGEGNTETQASGIELYKDLKGFWAKQGDLLLDKATQFNVRYAKLLGMNELEDEPLPYDMFVFLERKKRVGTEEFHIVKPNETLHLIAQKEAILLENLLYYNNLNKGEEPEVGERLTLQYKGYDKPKLKPKFLDVFSKETTVEKNNVEVKSVDSKTPEIVKSAEAAPVKLEVNEAALKLKRAQEAAEQEAKRIDEQKAIEAAEEEARRVAQAAAEEEARIEKEAKQKATDLAAKQAADLAAKQIEVKKDDIQTNTTPVVEDGKVQAILDMEKAKRTAALLGGDIKDATLVPPPPVIEKSVPATVEITTPIVEKVETKIAPPKSLEVPDHIKNRKYDEANINDSVKTLKKKFDQIVYKPIPEKVKTEPKAIAPKAEPKPAPKTSTSTAKVQEPKKEEPAKKAIEQKNPGVVKTATGVKKQGNTQAKKEIDNKKQEVKPNNKSAKSKQEETIKKKQEEQKAKSKDTKKNTATKTAANTKPTNKKAPEKKKK